MNIFAGVATPLISSDPHDAVFRSRVCVIATPGRHVCTFPVGAHNERDRCFIYQNNLNQMLAGKVALVTGSTSGIGLEVIARPLPVILNSYCFSMRLPPTYPPSESFSPVPQSLTPLLRYMGLRPPDKY